jgi:hypothetical protein
LQIPLFIFVRPFLYAFLGSLTMRYLGHELIVAIPHEMEVYFEFVPWIIFSGSLQFVEDEIDGLFSKPIPNYLAKTAAPK